MQQQILPGLFQSYIQIHEKRLCYKKRTSPCLSPTVHLLEKNQCGQRHLGNKKYSIIDAKIIPDIVVVIYQLTQK